MDAWELWMAMAREASETAQIAEAAGHLRSAASRYYYAAYQAVTALLHYRGVAVSEGRQAWSHDQTPGLITEQLTPLLKARNKREDLAQRLERLYKTRIIADYLATQRIHAGTLQAIRKDSNYILKVAEKILPERR